MQISKRALVAAVVSFLGLFGTVFFLLGRESVRRRAPAVVLAAPVHPAPDPVPVLPSTAATSAPSPPLPTIAVMPAPLPAVAPALPTAALPPGPPPAAASPPPAPIRSADPAPAAHADPGTAAVRDYFQKMQAIQTVGPTGDTGELANKLLAASMTGDTSGLDELIRAAEAGAASAGAITPPAACADYHQRLIRMLGESVGMVRQLKTALTTKDATALSSLAASGSSLQTRANALEDEAQQLKTRFGVR